MIDQQVVEKIALLSRLKLTPQELQTMTVQLQRILSYVDQLNTLDTTGVQPLAHTAELCNVFAEDRLQRSLDREAALANAPKRDEACFRVPAVLGD